MSEEIVFRIANAGDSRGIAELMGQLGYPSAVSDVEQRVARLSASGSERVIVTELDGQCVGVVGVHLIPLLHASGNLGRITALVVAKEHQERGIGRRLVMEAEAWAWIHECSLMEVISADHRSGAHRFYEACGYTCEKRHFLKQRERGGRQPGRGGAAPRAPHPKR